MTTAWNRSNYLTLFLAIVVSIATGCATTSQDNRKGGPCPWETEALQNTLVLYENCDFKKALDRFQELAENAESDIITCKAKLGEICCLVMLANTPADYLEAIEMWNRLENSVYKTDMDYYFTLMDPVMIRLTAEKTIPDFTTAPPKQPDIVQKTVPKTPTMEDTKAKAELKALRKKAKRVDELQLKIDEIDAENQSLREKINALEAIDQNLQKKKTEIATPSE